MDPHPLFIGGSCMGFRVLDAYVEERLTWGLHAAMVTKKAEQRQYVLRTLL